MTRPSTFTCACCGDVRLSGYRRKWCTRPECQAKKRHLQFVRAKIKKARGA